MAKFLKQLVRRTVFSDYDNLVALDEPYRALERLLRKQKVTGILDAGASTGRVARRLLRSFPDAKAYAFEPNRRYNGALNEAAAEEPRLIPQFLGLSDEAGELELHITESVGSTSLFKPSGYFKESHPKEAVISKTEKITTVTLDGWRQENGNPEIQLMKFDIQAGELVAMRGAKETLRQSTLVVYTEIFFNVMYDGGAIYSEIDLFLREQGFMLYNIYKPRSDGNGMLNQANAVFIHGDRLKLA